MKSGPATTARLGGDSGYPELKRHVIVATGLAYYQDKDEELLARVAQRMVALRLDTCTQYLDKLLDHSAGVSELDALTAHLTIGETFFFRHRELFDALRERVIPELLERNQGRRQLRVWSAGCAIGAEPYSLAILLKQDFAQQLTGWEVSIIATDINREFLAQAERGEFGPWSFRSAPEDLQATCFVRSSSGWVIKEEFRRDVSFQYHNLVQHPFPSIVNNLCGFDLILCRNVMIYFEPAIVRRLIGQFNDCLVDDGWLAVGHAEPNVESYRAFRTVNAPGSVLYQKSSPAPTFDNWTPPSLPPLPPVEPWLNPPAPATTAKAEAPVSAARANRDMKRTTVPQPGPPSAVSTAAGALAEVRQMLDRGDWDAALAACARLHDELHLHPLLHFYHALAAEQRGRHAECEQALRRALYLDRDMVLAHYYLGLALHRNRDARGAQRAFRNVLALLQPREETEAFADADGLTVGALRQLTEMHLEVLNRS